MYKNLIKPHKLFVVKGNTQKLDGGAMFGNAPKEMWQKWYTPDSMNRIHLACNCLLADFSTEKNKKIVLFEAGVGAFFDPKMKLRFGIQEEEHVLLQNLAQLGYSPNDVTHVVLSHLHFDHAGGILSSYETIQKSTELVFKNAIFLVSKQNFDRAVQPHSRDKASFIPELNTLLKNSGKLELVENENHSLSGAVEFLFSHGHTPGLMMSEIHISKKIALESFALSANGMNNLPENIPIIFSSDLIPGAAWINPALTMGYDRYPELVVDEKKALLKTLQERNGALFFTHDLKQNFGFIQLDESGKIFLAQ
jgi:glyoxylase-like metal-dependent hydrolase (beta-lactamase superfamily II)